MLVLSRRKGESIVINDDIEVTVADVGRNRVRLSFRAPDSVRILREEVVFRELDRPTNRPPRPLAAASG